MTVALWIAVGVLALGVAASIALILQMLRQYGRLLLRLDVLEERVEGTLHASANGRPHFEGISPATEFPSFRLPALGGETVALEELRGRRVLLVNWDPRCGFCREIVPTLAALESDLRKRRTELVLVSRGDAEENRRLAEEHGLEATILLQEADDRIEPFAAVGTPVAYLLDERGRVAKPLARGALEVPELAADAAGMKKRLRTERSLNESRLEREGLPAGTQAPAFRLPDLVGRDASLEDYRGRRVLLVFSDPQCGPCDTITSDLAAFHAEHGADALEIVMVSRGPVEENRRKAEAHGVEFRLLVQPGWRVSKEYGIFATPVAFLIDENGVIEREVAKGAPAILRLAQDAVGERKEVPLA